MKIFKYVFLFMLCVAIYTQETSQLRGQSQNNPLNVDNWTLASTGPWSGREGVMGVSSGDYIYMAGGRGFFGLRFYNDVWRSKDGIQWEKVLENAPWAKRAYHIMLNLDECIFVLGGQNFQHFYNDVWKSCDGGQNWQQMIENAPWVVRAGLAATVYNNEIYVTGGSFQTTPFSTRSFYNDVWKSVDGTKWELLTRKAEFEPLSGMRLVVFNDMLYTIGGENGFTEETQFQQVFSSKDGVNWVDEGNAEWSKRSGHGVVVYNDTMYVIAGYLNLHDIWSSTDAKTWKKLGDKVFNCEDKNCGRFDFWSLVHKDNLVVFGGSSAKTTFGKMFNETWVLPLK